MPEKLIYEILNPWTKEPFFVGETSDLETRKEAHKLWAGNVRLGNELQDIRSTGKEPLYEVIETVRAEDTVKRLTYWIGHRLQCGATLFNRLPDPKKPAKKSKTQKTPALYEVNVTGTFSFPVSLPRELIEDPRFKIQLTPDMLGTDLLSVYVGQLILQDFARQENASLIDFIDWLYA